MEDRLKQVWAASAAVETLQVEMDQAKARLDAAIDEAVQAGVAPEAVSGAANLAPLDVGQDDAPLSEEPA
ncbi:hypothetical protein LVY72_02675 [Arthrobacter sp. I2-34]|uniref:Uncharacterized protein n=1 Tax=Arthrobacter hankyongi TaxID=2904801 RepID=A0ABS9L2E1_9MICC|nr:hypothetical protein [Arthrobacter hankyongi]MCG2620814.1 hypothetical protein [Arthrobacter hankyongi]